MRQEEEITGKVTVDPLKRLEEILENEDFDNERISYVQLEPAPKKPSSFTELRRKHPRLALAAALVIGTAAWAKAMIELYEVLK